MIVIRPSAKLAKKIKESPADIFPQAENFYVDWSANLFLVGRIQFILISNTATLFSVVLPGKGITDASSFEKAMLETMVDFLKKEGHEKVWEQWILPESDSIRYSKALNRSVTGSMNDHINSARYCMTERNLTLTEVSRVLNGNPLSYLKYARPNDLFGEKLYPGKDQ